ncbi:MAG: DUF1259 domain-containing protein [Gemmatimonadaceae bacterium]
MISPPSKATMNPPQAPAQRFVHVAGYNALVGLLAGGVLGSFAGTAAAQQPVRAHSPHSATDWSPIDQTLGRKGAMQSGDVMKYSFPRSDLQVTVNGIPIKPALALGSWIALKPLAGGHAMMMGDLVLTEDEVAAVMLTLQQGGVEQTALHNHVLGESPRVMYMHVVGHNNPLKLAQAVRSALARTKTPLEAPAPPAPSAPIDLDTAGIAGALGVSGKVNGGVYQITVPRRETIREGDREVPSSMGLATAINFQPTGEGKAAITGDFVMIASEVNPVIRALQENGIGVTALHSHMLIETPRLLFMHFWANDDAVKLARGLRRALDRTTAKPALRAVTP